MTTQRRKDRDKAIQDFWSTPPHDDVDVITDVIDRGDHLKVTSCTKDVAAWWLGTLRAVYPQDHYSGHGDCIKMHPEAGVTLQLDRSDGTLRIKGKKHLQWFRQNFDHLMATGSKEFSAMAELGKFIDSHVRIDDGYTIRDLLRHLPATGAVKHGPTYVYRLWRGLLDQWLSEGGDIYVISPLLDARRLSELLLLLVKHRLACARVHVFVMPHCDGDAKFRKVLKDAREIIRELKGPNKRRLVAEERLKLAEQRLEAKFGRFHCKMVAVCRDGHAELMLTSASFHKYHFDMESGDTVMFFKMASEALINHYLAPLGLEHQVSFVDSPGPSSVPTTPTTPLSALTPTSPTIPVSPMSPMTPVTPMSPMNATGATPPPAMTRLPPNTFSLSSSEEGAAIARAQYPASYTPPPPIAMQRTL